MRRRDLFKGALAALFTAKLPMPLTMTVPIAPAVMAYRAVPYGLSIPFTINKDDAHYPLFDEIIEAMDRAKFAEAYRALQIKSIWSMTPAELAAAYPSTGESFDEYDDDPYEED